MSTVTMPLWAGPGAKNKKHNFHVLKKEGYKGSQRIAIALKESRMRKKKKK
jgi:hypothetical protein